MADGQCCAPSRQPPILPRLSCYYAEDNDQRPLSILLSNDLSSYYRTRELVPTDMRHRPSQDRHHKLPRLSPPRAIEAEGIKLLFDQDGEGAGIARKDTRSTYRAERPTTKEYRIPMGNPPRPRLKPTQAQLPVSPSSALLRFANRIASSGGGLVLDVGCGYGRNAVAIATRGCTVVCVDRDLSRLNMLERVKAEYIKSNTLSEYKSGKILSVCANLDSKYWSFPRSIFNAMICVHFVEVSIFPCLMSSLRSGGYFYFETFGGQGGNFEALPKTGEIRDALRGCNLEYYSEKRVGPRERDAVSVKVLARKY